MIRAYVDWREACRLVNDTSVAHWRYNAALDAEEGAAEAYAGLVPRGGHLATCDGDPSGALAA